MRDLVVLVADKCMDFVLRTGLERPESLGIRPVSFEIRQHPNREGGVRTNGAQILALERHLSRHALMILDYEGSGASDSAERVEKTLDAALVKTWQDRAKAFVIMPELEMWMWGATNLMAEIFRWPKSESVRDWLTTEGFYFQPDGKPGRPKEALEAAFAICRIPRSAANYRKIVSRIGMAQCRDPAFRRLRRQLALWFPPKRV